MSFTLALVLLRRLRCPTRRAGAFGRPCGRPALAAVIGWALAHHELDARPGPASSLRRLKRIARAFGQPFGLPESLSLACPRESNQREGHPSSAPLVHPCTKGSREAVGVFGQAVPGLSKTLAASLRPTLRADRPPPAAPQGPRGRARAPARKSRREKPKREARSEKREARSEKREARSEKREARSEKREARSEKREARSGTRGSL
jgi:type IV secretory pathway VirB10-like protein